jgi:hypothetical protein
MPSESKFVDPMYRYSVFVHLKRWDRVRIFVFFVRHETVKLTKIDEITKERGPIMPNVIH